jgi:hypothetical protein
VEDVWKHVEDETDDHLGGCDDDLHLVTMWWD